MKTVEVPLPDPVDVAARADMHARDHRGARVGEGLQAAKRDVLMLATTAYSNQRYADALTHLAVADELDARWLAHVNATQKLT